LTSDQLRSYLKKGSIKLGKITIEEGWLKVEKIFKDEYQQSDRYAVASSDLSCVLLETAMDQTLIRMGHAREMTNRIQRLRRSLGISIDDQIEVFYKVNQEGSELASVLSEYGDQIRKVIKMPFLPADCMQKAAAPFGEALYENPDDANDFAQLLICQQAIILVREELEKSFGSDSDIKLDSLASVVGNYSPETLKKKVDKKGNFKINLDGKDIVLKYKQHFWYSLKDQGKGMAPKG
jgi:hypothetical protein